MTHKTFGGMAKAVEQEIAYLNTPGDPDEIAYREHDRTSALIRELDALWSNPADQAEADRLKNRLLDAWHKATS